MIGVLPDKTMPNIERPLVTFALFAYNHEAYICKAVQGAFAQTYSPLEIILSDDCSIDRTFEIMQDMVNDYRGPHKVILNRNRTNRGIAAHYSDIVKIASGKYIALAAGDDISLSNRVATSVSPFFDISGLSFVQVGYRNFSDSLLTDVSIDVSQESFSLVTLQSYLQSESPVLLGASRTIKKECALIFPDLGLNCPEEDKPSIFRLLMTGSAAYLHSPLVLRRIHNESLSSPKNLSKMNSAALLEQFVTDLSFANRNNLIDKSMAEFMDRWLRKYVKRRELLTSYRVSETRVRDFFFAILPSRSISLQQKLNEAKRLFLRSK